MNASKEDLRVSIDTMSDWSLIKENYTKAAQVSLERELAAAGLSSSSTLSRHLDKFIQQTFQLAQPNLRVNGQSFDERDIEPFDEALDRHVWSLHAQRLGLHKTIAATRRSEPMKIEKSMLASLEQDRTLDAAELEWDDPHEDAASDNAMDEDLENEIGESLLKTSAWAQELSQSIPNQTERTERLKNVTAELKKPERR